MKRFTLICVIAGVLLAANLAAAVPYDWAMFYEHVNQNGGGYKFSIRGLAAAQDGSNTFYYGHIQNAYDGVLPDGTLNIVHMNLSGSILHSITVTEQPKTLATDGRGYVYAGGVGQVTVYPSDLASPTTTITIASAGTNKVEGVTVENGGSYYLYATSRSNGNIARYDITDIFNPVLDTAWATSGVYTLPTTDLRGTAVDPNGDIWVADKGADTVYKIAADGLSHSSTTVDDPMDIVLCPIYAYVSSQDGNTSTVEQLLISDMSLQQSLYDSIVDSGYENHYGFGGLDIIGDKLYVADEDSWRIDGPGGYGDPETSYGDRIFTIDIPACGSPIPEPTTVLMILGGLAGFAGIVYRRR